MDYDSHLRALHPSLCNVVNYGEGPVGSMMALMTDHQEQETEHQQQQQQLNILQATTTTAAVHAPSFAYYNATLEPYLQSALFQAAHAFHQIHHVEPQTHCTLEHLDAHAVVNSAEEEKPDLASKLVHGAGQFSGGRECYISTGPSVLVSPGANSTTHDTRAAAASAASMDTDTNNPTDHPDPIRAKIIAHPAYPRLVVAYVNCNKIGAPPEVVTRLDEVGRKYQNFRSPSPSAIGADPELDQFMETYYNVLQKYHEELTQPFKEAMAFFRKIELQLNALSKGSLRLSQSGDDKTEANTQGSSGEEEGEEEGDGSCGEVDFHDDMIDPLAEDHKLKEQLLRKYSGYICSLKQEFLKKKKKGKLPKDARQKLLDWWSQHYKWPYPSEAEKAALAETTGLDQKQINNWFINQRKRHWKPSEDMQYVMVDSPGHAHHHLHVTSAHGPNISFVDNMDGAGTIIPMQ